MKTSWYKRTLALILTLALMLSIIPAGYASDSGGGSGYYVANYASGGSDISGDGSYDHPYLTIANAIAQAKAAGDNAPTVILLSDITSTTELVFNDPDMEITITSQGYRKLYYSGTTSIGTNSGFIHVTDGAVVHFENLALSGSTGSFNARVLYVAATVTLDGVTVSGGRVNQQGAENGGAAAYIADGGSLTATVTGFTANQTTAGGGAIYVADGGYLRLEDRTTVTANTAKNGGGIYVEGQTKDYGGTVLTGNVKIQGNTVSGSGAGVYVEKNSNITVSGAVEISANTVGSKLNNVYLAPDATMDIAGATTEANIGVTADPAQAYRLVSLPRSYTITETTSGDESGWHDDSGVWGIRYMSRNGVPGLYLYYKTVTATFTDYATFEKIEGTDINGESVDFIGDSLSSVTKSGSTLTVTDTVPIGSNEDLVYTFTVDKDEYRIPLVEDVNITSSGNAVPFTYDPDIENGTATITVARSVVDTLTDTLEISITAYKYYDLTVRMEGPLYAMDSTVTGLSDEVIAVSGSKSGTAAHYAITKDGQPYGGVTVELYEATTNTLAGTVITGDDGLADFTGLESGKSYYPMLKYQETYRVVPKDKISIDLSCLQGQTLKADCIRDGLDAATVTYDYSIGKATISGISDNATITFSVNQVQDTISFIGSEGDATTAPATLSMDTKTMTESATTYGALATASLVGYTFGGWYTEAEGGDLVTAETAYVSGVSPRVLYAHWTANTDTAYQVQHWIEYDPTGYNSGLTDTRKTVGGVTYYLYQTDSYRDGVSDQVKDITGLGLTDMADTDQTWWTVDGLTATFEQNCKVLADGSSVFSVYYDRNTYTISFDPSGAGTAVCTDSFDPMDKKFGQQMGTLPTPSMPGYVFAGWYRGDQLVTATPYYNVAGNTHAVAKWNPKENTEYAVHVMVQNLTTDDKGRSVGADTFTLYKTVYLDNESLSLNGKTDTSVTFAVTDIDELTIEGFDYVGYSSEQITKTSDDAPFTWDGTRAVVYIKPTDASTQNGREYNDDFDGGEVFLYYIRRTASVTTEDDQGNTEDSGEIVYGGNFTGILPDDPGRDGYDFTGWMDEDGKPVTEDTPADPYVTDDEELILIPTWEARTYRLTYVPGTNATFVATDSGKGKLSAYIEGGYVDSAEITYGEPIGEMPTAYKAGYDFIGWYLPDGVTKITSETIVSIENVIVHNDAYSYEQTRVLYARFEPHIYTLNLDAGTSRYGVAATVNPTEITVTYDSEIDGLPVPVLEGYTFVSWMLDPGDASTVITNGDVWIMPLGRNEETTTAYATYIPNTYKYTFDLNDNTGSTKAVLKDTTVNYSEETFDSAYAGIFSVEAVRSGYAFKGWSLTRNGKPLTAADLNKLSNDATLYAVWEANTYSITFAMRGAKMDLNDNKGPNFKFYQERAVYAADKDIWTVPITFDAMYGTALEQANGDASGKLPYPNAEDSRRFLGWLVDAPHWSTIHGTILAPDADDGFPRLPQYTDYADDGITLSAVMDPLITFVDGDFRETAFVTDLTELPDREKDEYTFLGWASEDGNIVDLDTVKETEEPLTLTAIYSAIVTFDAGNGKVNGKESAAYTLADLNRLPTASRSGYTFDGWYSEKENGEKITLAGLKKTNIPVTLYAHYTVIRSNGGGYSTPTTYTIQVTKGDGVDIGVDGDIRVTSGGSKTVLMEIQDGYRLTDVLVDGVSVGTVTKYEFKNVRENHTMEIQTVKLLSGDHIAFVKGYPDGSFGPEREITRAETAMMFYRLLTNDAVMLAAEKAGTVPYYEDTPKEAWYIDAVMVLTALGIVEGRGNHQFAPEDYITRAEFATIATRFAKLEDGDCAFSDVTENHWAYKYIVSAAAKGWILGYPDGTFRPDNSITRAEAVTLVDRATGRIPDTEYIKENRQELKSFPDVEERHWAYGSVMEAANAHDYIQAGDEENWTGLK